MAPSPTQNSGWSALFGYTGLSIGAIGFSATDALLALAVASIVLIVSGTRYSRKLLGLGLLLLVVFGLAEVGFLITGLILTLYLASFFVIRSRFTPKTRRPGTQGEAP
jgi:hypothetical protein